MADVDVQDAIVIDAPRQKVWDAIADPAKQEAWNPFVSRITGQHALNATRTVTGLCRRRKARARSAASPTRPTAGSRG